MDTFFTTRRYVFSILIFFKVSPNWIFENKHFQKLHFFFFNNYNTNLRLVEIRRQIINHVFMLKFAKGVLFATLISFPKKHFLSITQLLKRFNEHLFHMCVNLHVGLTLKNNILWCFKLPLNISSLHWTI